MDTELEKWLTEKITYHQNEFKRIKQEVENGGSDYYGMVLNHERAEAYREVLMHVLGFK